VQVAISAIVHAPLDIASATSRSLTALHTQTIILDVEYKFQLQEGKEDRTFSEFATKLRTVVNKR